MSVAPKLVLEPGSIYSVKHSSGIINAAFICETKHTLGKRTVTRYHFKNIKTDREIVIKSRGKVKAYVGRYY